MGTVTGFSVSSLKHTKGKMWRNLEKFWLLTWKNWLLQWRHPVQTVVEILAPVIFSILLVLIRSLVDPEPNTQEIYPAFNLDDSAHVFYINSQNNTFLINTIAWSPCTNVAINSIMQRVAATYNLQSECRQNAADLQIYMQANFLQTFAGFQFDDSYAQRDTIDPNVQVIFRYPGELRTSGTVGLGESNWRTNILFPLYQMAGPRSPFRLHGAPPEYFHETFLTFQYEISREIINYFVNDPTIELPTVVMRRFPYPAWIDDPLLTALQSFVGIIIMLSFVYTCINTVKVITTEKEKQLKEAMKIMGLPNWLHWTAWFVKSFFFLLLSIILIVVLLKVSWYPDTDVSVFTHADPFVMFLFLVFYVCATITFCFAVSVFFSKANTAATIAGLCWFLSYCPYLFLQERYHQLSLAEKLLASLGSNTAMAYGFQLMLMFEGSGEGLQWNNIFSSVSPDDDLTLGLIMIMLIVDTLLYLLIALYVEAVFPGEFGVPQVWYFPFTKTFWCGNKTQVDVDDNDNVIPTTLEYQKEPTNLRPGVKIKNLRKVYSNKKVAVRDFSMNMYEDQITVLLGHNGAGKTTTMSMLTGMFPPTSGTAIVNGYDIRTNMVGVRDSLGLCPQHNIIFEELTVKEHLYFFSRLKGLDKKEIEQEITKYIELLELVPKTNQQAKTLSGGMKRKLCVGMALCGNSKVVMFDEPTAGMDPAARRALWDLMETQKKGRTILLSTHFMDEADLLGDRIAIMAGGQLQCCGSSFFLKKRYGAGYHLIMDKSLKCDVSKITDLLRVHIPNIEVESNVGSELTYILSENQASVFEEMLSDLESNGTTLGINSYGISLTTLEEVFMKVGADHGQEEDNDELDLHNKNKDVPLLREQNGNFNNSSDTKLNAYDKQFLTGFALWRNQFLAMMMKRILSTLRSWILFLIQNLIPVAFLIIAIIVNRGNNVSQDLPSLDYTLDAYDSVTVMTTDNASNSFYNAYRELLLRENREITDWESGDMVQHMLIRTEENTPRVRMQYIIGATFEVNASHSDIVTAWFNNEPYHSPPVALEYAMNSILQAKMGPEHSIQIILHPLPFSVDTRFSQLAMGNNMGFQLAFNIGFSMAFVAAFYVLFYVRERVTNSKHLQFVSGVDVLIFWGSSFLWDLITFIFTSLCLIITLVAFQEDGFSSAEDLGRIFAVLLCFAIAFLPLMFLASYMFDIPSTGFTRMTLFNIFSGVAVYLVVQVLRIETLDLVDVANGLHWAFLFLPHYSLCTAMNDMSLITSIQNLCDFANQLGESMLEENIGSLPIDLPNLNISYACYIRPNECCDIQENFFAWDNNGIGRNILFSICIGVILSVILLLNEFRLFDNIKYKIEQRTMKAPPAEENQDNDVLEEKRKIQTGEIRIDKTTVVLKNITKYYKKFLAVNQLCLGINEYECFGLLGVNGAGKTSTFKMMTGDVNISYGDGWINGLNIKTDLKKVHKYIGYCPQFDALLDDLTGKETLMMYCLLRGIPLRDSKFVAEQLARDFDFHRHIDKKVKEYSGGNKRKLSAAVALIGDPPIVFLDEPTTGMDPATKRNLWNTLCHIRDNGKCLVLTSHSMEECEALCTRLAIMVNGVFKCLGSTQHLKNKFSQGYTLVIKLHKSELNISELESIERFVKTNFPSAIVRERHQELLTFYIPDTSVPWSRMFGIMERGKKQSALNIEDYSLGQSSLEQVFLSFTKKQIG